MSQPAGELYHLSRLDGVEAVDARYRPYTNHVAHLVEGQPPPEPARRRCACALFCEFRCSAGSLSSPRLVYGATTRRRRPRPISSRPLVRSQSPTPLSGRVFAGRVSLFEVRAQPTTLLMARAWLRAGPEACARRGKALATAAMAQKTGSERVTVSCCRLCHGAALVGLYSRSEAVVPSRGEGWGTCDLPLRTPHPSLA